MALSARDIAYAALLAIATFGAAHVVDRVAYGVEMTKLGLTGREFGVNR